MDFYDRYILPYLVHVTMRSRLLTDYRRDTAGQAHNIVLELGFGSGLNLPFYDSDRVRLVYALEPDPNMLTLARKRIARAPFPVTILRARAEHIPLPDASVDTVVSTCTLCTIPDIEAALADARRVLKPEGRFLFADHGLSPESRVARWQHRLTPYWCRCAGGCHLDRPHDELLKQAGFALETCATDYAALLKPMSYMYTGRASRQ